jgi:hypothetical protein
MPFVGSQNNVGSAQAMILVQAGAHAQSIHIRNAGTTNSVYLGDASVTAPGGANPGYELPPGQTTPMMQLDPIETVAGICASGLTTRVDVVQSYSA